MPVGHHADLESSLNPPIRVAYVCQAGLFLPHCPGREQGPKQREDGASTNPTSWLAVYGYAVPRPGDGNENALLKHVARKKKRKEKKKNRMASCISSTRRPCKGQPRPGRKFSGTGALYQGKGMPFHLCISPQALT